MRLRAFVGNSRPFIGARSTGPFIQNYGPPPERTKPKASAKEVYTKALSEEYEGIRAELLGAGNEYMEELIV